MEGVSSWMVRSARLMTCFGSMSRSDEDYNLLKETPDSILSTVRGCLIGLGIRTTLGENGSSLIRTRGGP